MARRRRGIATAGSPCDRGPAARTRHRAISDHYHPWLDSHGHSPFAWSVLGAIASRTARAELMTAVTCPILRYHPDIACGPDVERHVRQIQRYRDAGVDRLILVQAGPDQEGFLRFFERELAPRLCG